MRRGSWILLLPLVAACATPPPPMDAELDIKPPARWSAADGAATSSQEPGRVEGEWWTNFDDPELSRVIEIALAENYDLQAAAARLDQAAAQARIAGADLKPSAGIGVTGTRTKQNFIGFPIPGAGVEVPSTTTSRFGVSLDLTWEVDLWGRIRAGARAAIADAQAAEAEVRGAYQSLAAQTAKAWFSVLEIRQQVELARSTVESWRESTEQVRSRFNRGLRPAVDLRLALSNLEAAEAVHEQRVRQLDAAMRQLETLLGRYPAATLLAEFDAGAMPPLPPPIPVGLPAELIARRPDLVVAERRLAAADQRFKEARRSLYPRLSLTATGGTATTQLGDLLDQNFSVWGLVANLTQPLFQGGRLRANVDRTEAGVDEAIALFAGAALRAYGEVETSLAAETYLAGQVAHLEASADQLVAARRLAEERYRLGVGEYLVVLDSQTREFTAKSRLLESQLARLENRVNLHLALGGGFDTGPTPGTGGADTATLEGASAVPPRKDERP